MDDTPPPFVEAERLARNGRPAEAHRAYRTCIERHPDFLPAHAGIARLLAAHGEIGEALQWLSTGLSGKTADGRAAVAQGFAALIGRVDLDAWHPQLDRDLRACLSEAGVDHQALARPVAALLLLKHADWRLDTVADDPLLIDFLVRCINVEPRLEPRLAALRRELLLRYADAPVIPPRDIRLIAALALQAFAGEYVWPVGAEETEQLERGASVLLSCLYRPLIERAHLPPGLVRPDSVRAELVEACSALVELLRERTLHDLQREQVLAAKIPTLTSATHSPTSAKVREQYEQNPYPRWQAPPSADPVSLPHYIASLPACDLPPPPWRVLIAGCGTGYEAIDMARRDPALTVTALDLSRASLAYGQRMAEELGVANVAFVQGDILDLPASPDRFDMVSSTGVLHHMDDPAIGLHALVAVTRPGGIIRLALYSKRARALVRAAHEAIARLGLDATPQGIRAFRAQILSLPDDDPLAVLKQSDDFYSMSGCRDLLFHVREHWFTLPRIGALLADAGLRLLALDAPPDGLAAFHAMYGNDADRLDLDRWDRVEALHPTLFTGMYHLWCHV